MQRIVENVSHEPGPLILLMIVLFLFAVCLLAALLTAFGWVPALSMAWLAMGFFMLFIIPVFVLNRILSRPVLFGRFRSFSFEKYHNTENHKSIF